jgi:putative tryptophan/tyrosine transport system substrate-binding protein
MEQVLSSFRRNIQENAPAASVKEVFLPDNENEAALTMDRLKASSPRVIFAMGSQAAVAAHRNLPGVPLTYAMVLDPASIGLSGGGIPLTVPPSAQLLFLKKNFPSFTRFGVIYLAGRSQAEIAEFRQIAGRGDVRIELVEIARPEALDAAWTRLRGRVDCLLTVPDTQLYSTSSFPQLILRTVQDGVPVVALTSPQVKAGALMALFWDFDEMGRVGAKAVLRVLGGEKPSELTGMSPSRIKTAFNMVVAKRLGVEMDRVNLQEAEEIVR